MSFSEFVESSSRKLVLWHGGDLTDGFKETVSHKKGRWEYGPGLYLITHYDTAKKYATGSRKLYQVAVEEGTNLDTMIDATQVLEWVKINVIKSKQKEVIERISKHNKENKINGEIFLNIIINNDAIKNTTTNVLRLFLVECGIDYCLVSQPFGWSNQLMLVLFNPKKIVSKKQITSKDQIEVFDLPAKFS
jgi:hypothetical protein